MEGSSSAMDGTMVASTPAPVSPAPASTPAPATTSEKMLSQSEVNDIVKRAKHDAVDTYRRQSVEQPQYIEQKYGSLPNQATQNTYSQDDIRKLAAEEAQRLRNEWISDTQAKQQEQEATRIANEFFNRLSAGKQKYEDFDTVTKVSFANFPNTVQLLTSYTDNTADVIYELGKDRAKLATLEQLARISPEDAVYQVQQLSESIKRNEKASNTRMANEPLSHLRPSNAGTDAGSEKSVRDYKAKYRG